LRVTQSITVVKSAGYKYTHNIPEIHPPLSSPIYLFVYYLEKKREEQGVKGITARKFNEMIFGYR